MKRIIAFLKANKPIVVYLGILSGVLLVTGLATYFFWLRPYLRQPMGESFTLPTLSLESGIYDPAAAPQEELMQIQEDYWDDNRGKPVCGSQQELLILAAAIDYRGGDYLYGLADVIRLIRVDFTEPQVNVVILPRALLVNVPTDRIRAENPILLNQAYFFGTPGMQYYVGDGFGAGSLAETIQYNFGISAQQYVVINFDGFIQLVDALGGVEVDLPEVVVDDPYGYFPAGKQTLNGEQALRLARVRKQYSDLIRTDNQTLILQAIFRKLQDPAVLLRLPEITATLQDAVITDGSPDQITELICVLQKMGDREVLYAAPPAELITTDWVYVPSVQQQMEVYRWDRDFTVWMYQSLWAQAE